MIPLLFILIFALLIPGAINKVRALFAGRRGYPYFQPLLNVSVLLQKASVYSTTSTIVTKMVAPLYLGATLVAALCIPLGAFKALISFNGDIVLLAALLATARLILVLGAMDSGSAFQGMSLSRELLFGMLAEPALYLLLMTLAMITGHYSLSSIFAHFDGLTSNMMLLSILVGYGFFRLSLAECGRVPMDDTRTHLELTMIHEGMLLDLSGVDLAFVNIASWLKLSIFGMLIANAVIPTHLSWASLIGAAILVQLVFALLIGLAESLRARNRMPKNIVYLTTISAVGLLSMVVAYLMISGSVAI